jgi:hypothetical protein
MGRLARARAASYDWRTIGARIESVYGAARQGSAIAPMTNRGAA